MSARQMMPFPNGNLDCVDALQLGYTAPVQNGLLRECRPALISIKSGLCIAYEGTGTSGT